ncbi:MAG: AAA family ATPase [Patescibacteria group bacterium]
MIVGITGWFASGKDTVADYLQEKGFKVFSLSDVIRDHLRLEGKELSRDNLRVKGNELRDQFGASFLAEQALKKISEDQSGSNYVIPSVRQMGEVEMLRQEPSFKLWAVDAPSRLRHQRLLERARTADEKDLSFDDFKAKEEQEKGGGPNCQQVDKVIEAADLTLDNGGSFENLYKQIDNLIGEK